MKYFLSILILVVIAILYFSFNKKNSNQSTSKNELKSKIVESKATNVQHKIDKKDYERFLLLKNTNENHLFQMITEYGNLSGNKDYKEYSFEITKSDNWHIIKVPEAIDFYVYHNLVSWLNGYEENNNNPEFSLGLSNHKNNSQEDYIFYLDTNNNFGDTHIGAFRNGKTFSIYLPDAYEEYGNLSITNKKNTSFDKVSKIILDNNFDIKKIKSLNFKILKINMSE